MALPTPHRATVVASPDAGDRRGADAPVTPLHPERAAPPRRQPTRARWTVLLVPPPRATTPVRAITLRRRALLPPALGVALLLTVASLGGARLGEHAEARRIAPTVGVLRSRLDAADERGRVLTDSLGALRTQLAALTDARDAATSTARRTSTIATRRAPNIVLPVQGRITSRFARSRLHPILRIPRPHRGLDIAAPSGTTITAPAAGRVTRVAREMGYGLVVHVDHGRGMTTRYAHCKSALVKAGDRVVAGEPIARVGATGLASAPHVHYEVRVRGEAVDPLRVAVVGAR